MFSERSALFASVQTDLQLKQSLSSYVYPFTTVRGRFSGKSS